MSARTYHTPKIVGEPTANHCRVRIPNQSLIREYRRVATGNVVFTYDSYEREGSDVPNRPSQRQEEAALALATRTMNALLEKQREVAGPKPILIELDECVTCFRGWKILSVCNLPISQDATWKSLQCRKVDDRPKPAPGEPFRPLRELTTADWGRIKKQALAAMNAKRRKKRERDGRVIAELDLRV